MKFLKQAKKPQQLKNFNDFFNRRSQVTTGFNAICFFQLTSRTDPENVLQAHF